ncbi:hypothetical protein UT300019_18110 [Clostridium sp. CTA-19]
MQLIEKFDLYLLILVIISGSMVFFADAKYFKLKGNYKAYKQARYISGGVMLLTIILFFIRLIYVI